LPGKNIKLTQKQFEEKAREAHGDKFDYSKADLSTALFIGFIDGDGCISKIRRNSWAIRTKIHSNWLGWLKMYSQRLQYISKVDICDPKIGKHGYATWSCGKKDFVLWIKSKVDEYQLPVLKRKWDKIRILK